MFFGTCGKCSLKSASIGKFRCLHCTDDAASNSGMGDNVLPPSQEIADARRNVSAIGASVVPIDMQAESTDLVQNRRINESSDKNIADNIRSHRQRRKYIDEVKKVIVPYSWPSRGDRNAAQGTSAASSNITSHIRQLFNKHNEFLNVEKSQSYNQGKKHLGEIKKPSMFNQNFGTPFEESARSMDNILAVPGTSGFCANEAVSNLRRDISQSKNPPEIQSALFTSQNTFFRGVSSQKVAANIEGHYVENLRFTDDILAVPGTSGFRANEDISNLSRDILTSENPPEIHSAMFIGPIGANIEGYLRTHEFKCSICTYETSKIEDLQMHNYIHCPKEICEICGQEYLEKDFHRINRACKLCKEKFTCKTLFDHHYVKKHDDYFSKHCWLCLKDIKKHFINYEERRKYACCCGIKHSRKSHFELHNIIHRPNLFCMLCRKQYPVGNEHLHNNYNNACMVCQARFSCQVLLENHLEGHGDPFSEHCLLCKREIYDHKIESEATPIYNCCDCSYGTNTREYLRRHLIVHLNLKLFKCKGCEKRFLQKETQRLHSKNCIWMTLLYKCEICRARFPDRCSLYAHRLLKHGITNGSSV